MDFYIPLVYHMVYDDNNTLMHHMIGTKVAGLLCINWDFRGTLNLVTSGITTPYLGGSGSFTAGSMAS